MNPYQLHQYQPFMGGPDRPSFGFSPSPSALDALFQDLTRRQILDAFGGQASPGLLDMLMNPQPAPAPAPVVAPPVDPATSAPVSEPAPEPTARYEGGGDGYSPFSNDTRSGPSIVSYGPNERGGWDVTNSAGVTTTTHANGAQTTSGGGGKGG